MHGSRGRAGRATAVALAVLLAGSVPARSEEDTFAPRLRVEFDGRLLTVAANDAPLDAVLRAVGEATALEVPRIDSSETFTGAFAGLPLDRALEWLLGDRSYLLGYDEAGEPERLVVWSDQPGAAAPEVRAVPEPAVERALPLQDETWIARRLTSPDRGTRIVAVRRLQRLPPERAAALGLKVLQAERDPVVRGQLAAALGRVEGDQVVNVLTTLLDDQDPSVRIAAARALGGLTDQAAPQALGRILVSGTDPALRQAALEALAARPDEAARDYLRRVAARSGDPMADAARQVLSGELAPPAAETVDPAVPCVHPAGLQKGCLKK
jgi:hypothetical protein